MRRTREKLGGEIGVANDVDLSCTRGSLEGPVTRLSITEIVQTYSFGRCWHFGRRRKRKECVKMLPRRRGRKRDEKKGTAIFLNIAEGESNAAAVEEAGSLAAKTTIRQHAILTFERAL